MSASNGSSLPPPTQLQPYIFRRIRLRERILAVLENAACRSKFYSHTVCWWSTSRRRISGKKESHKIGCVRSVSPATENIPAQTFDADDCQLARSPFRAHPTRRAQRSTDNRCVGVAFRRVKAQETCIPGVGVCRRRIWERISPPVT